MLSLSFFLNQLLLARLMLAVEKFANNHVKKGWNLDEKVSGKNLEAIFGLREWWKSRRRWKSCGKISHGFSTGFFLLLMSRFYTFST